MNNITLQVIADAIACRIKNETKKREEKEEEKERAEIMLLAQDLEEEVASRWTD